MKALAILSLLTLGTPASTQSGLAPTTGIVRVDCDRGSGTAFRIGPSEYVSVAHVTGLAGCSIGGRPFTVTYRKGDFTVFMVSEIADKWLRIDCGGFIPDHHYIALGFARGLDTETSVDLTASPWTISGEAILLGIFTVIPGQSGGPVIDAGSGAVVGTVNAYEMESGASFSTPLKGTALCPS